MRKLLKQLLIIQEISNKNRKEKLGRGFFTARRFNPYNPLSYVVLVIIFFVGILMFGLVGFWRETGGKNPFKWD